MGADLIGYFVHAPKNWQSILLSRLLDAKAVIDRLANEGRYFDTRDNSQGLQGAINDAIAQARGE